MRASADLEMQQVVNEVRRQVEKEKEIAIAETKRKKWVRLLYTYFLTFPIHLPLPYISFFFWGRGQFSKTCKIITVLPGFLVSFYRAMVA